MSLALIILLIGSGIILLFAAAALAWRIREKSQEDGNEMPVPAGRRDTGFGPSDSSSPNSASPDKNPYSIVQHILESLSPDVAGLPDLSKLSIPTETADGRPLSNSERREAVLRALDELAAREPQNPLFQAMRESLQKRTGDSIVQEESKRIRVFRLMDQITIIVDGVEYPDAESIPDDSDREQVRRILALG